MSGSSGNSKNNEDKKSVVLAYSGGLDTSCLLVWLIEQGYQVVAYLANLGQVEDFEAARTKAIKLGAIQVIIEDLREELVRDFAWPAVQANLIYEDRYLLGTAIARPCIVQGLIKTADKYGAGYISHGATGKGNDQIRFELGIYALRPNLQIIAPWKDRSFYNRFQGRQDLFRYAEKHHIPLPVTPKSPWSIDANILHVSYESGVLENPATSAPLGIFEMTMDPEKAPEQASFITIDFERGIPSSLLVHQNFAQINSGEGEKFTDDLPLFIKLNKLGSLHGIGRIDIVENRAIGLKSRGLYESPALTILRAAHLDLEAICLDREVAKIRRYLSEKMTEQVYNGLWYSPEFIFTRKCVETSQENVTGSVTLKLYKGNAYPICRTSPVSLYNQELVSMDVQGDYQPVDALGFIRVSAVRLREHARIAEKQKKDTSIDKLQ